MELGARPNCARVYSVLTIKTLKCAELSKYFITKILIYRKVKKINNSVKLNNYANIKLKLRQHSKGYANIKYSPIVYTLYCCIVTVH